MEREPSPRTGTAVKAVRFGLVFAIALGLAFILIKTQPRPEREEPVPAPPLVETLEVRPLAPEMVVRAYGTIRSGETLNLTARVSGTIVERAPGFEEGEFFPEDTFLLRIDPRDYRLAVERLRAEIERLGAEEARLEQERRNLLATRELARQDLSLAQAEYERNVSLLQRGAAAQSGVDQARQKLLASKAGLQEIENGLALIDPRRQLISAQKDTARAQLNQALLDLERTEVRTPFPCRLVEKSVERGQFVTVGAPLARIYNTEIMEVEVRIPLNDAAWLPLPVPGSPRTEPETATRARITFSAPSLTLTWNGAVSRVKALVDERTRTLPLVVRIDAGPDSGITPGMFVTVELIGRQVDNLFLLPRETVHEGGQVYLAREETVRIIQVTPVRRQGNEVYVTGGLTAGDLVILRIPGVLTEGQKVRARTLSRSDGEAS